jgi:hypothetical protein
MNIPLYDFSQLIPTLRSLLQVVEGGGKEGHFFLTSRGQVVGEM